MNKKTLANFLIEARKNTYASGHGKVKPFLPGSVQMEYSKGKTLYRDIYNIGNGIFIGMETVYLNNHPVWSMSYFGNFRKLKEEEVDKMLRTALSKFASKTRLWKNINWKNNDFIYTYNADSGKSINEFGGSEQIIKNGRVVYYFYCAGGYIGN